MAASGITVTKKFTYRGSDEEWGNTYHFHGSAPSSADDWRSLCDDLIAIEKECYPDTVTVVRVLCYEDTDDDSVYTYNLADFAGVVPGTFTPDEGDQRSPGDAAVWAAWNTGNRSSQGKYIWLRKYFHGCYDDGTDQDKTSDALVGNLQNFADAAVIPAGDWPGLAGPDGVIPGNGTRVSEWITTRTLKRRGRRPTSGS